MNLILTHTGSYPRIGDKAELQILRTTTALWERGQKTFAELEAARDAMTRLAIAEQVEAGLDLVTDGQIRWSDPISHIAGKLQGVSINGLLRFFDTNFYFRQPVVTDRLVRYRPMIVDEFLFARSVSLKPVKPVLTGPYTLAVFSIVQREEYKNLEKLVEDYAGIVAEEVKALAHAGAEVIQVDEPAVLRDDARFDLFASGVCKLAEAAGSAKLALYTYFGDAASMYSRLQELPADIIGIDFTYNERLVEIIAVEGSSKPLGLGLVDGRNTKLESEERICQALEKLLPAITSDYSYLNPSSGLEYLPRDRAFMKLKNMVEIGKRFQR
ncbi:MAG: methylcobamide--CoM methyltransferase [candidate division WOR-3 bacterium]